MRMVDNGRNNSHNRDAVNAGGTQSVPTFIGPN